MTLITIIIGDELEDIEYIEGIEGIEYIEGIEGIAEIEYIDDIADIETEKQSIKAARRRK